MGGNKSLPLDEQQGELWFLLVPYSIDTSIDVLWFFNRRKKEEERTTRQREMREGVRDVRSMVLATRPVHSVLRTLLT